MLGSIQGLGKLGYGSLYVVPATYLYLLATKAVFPIPYVGTLNPRIETGVLLAASLYATIWLHRATLLIFGENGGLESSLKSEVSTKHLAYFATGIPPNELPDSSSAFTVFKEAVAMDQIQWGVFLRFLPAGLFYGYLVFGWVWLTFLFIAGEEALVAGAFWLILSVFVFQKRVTGYLPNYIPPESAESFDEAEYITTYRQITQTENETDSTQRIKKRQPTDPNRRIR